MQLIDIGANLTRESFRAGFDQILERAQAHGVMQMIVTGASVAGSGMAWSWPAGIRAGCLPRSEYIRITPATSTMPPMPQCGAAQA